MLLDFHIRISARHAGVQQPNCLTGRNYPSNAPTADIIIHAEPLCSLRHNTLLNYEAYGVSAETNVGSGRSNCTPQVLYT